MTLSQLQLKSILALFLIIAIVIPVSASVSLSGTIKFMKNVTPGETVSFPITLTSTEPADYELTVMGFGNDNTGGYVGIAAERDTNPQSARSYIKLSQTDVHIDKTNPVTVTAEVDVPQNSAGGLYALINIHPKPVSISGTSIVTAINIPVMITLTGTEIVESGIINDVTVSKNGEVITSFTNNGNHHYYGVSNKVIVSNPSLISTKTITSAIVPGGTIIFTHNLNKSDLKEGSSVKSEVIISNKPAITSASKTVGSDTVSVVKSEATPTTEVKVINNEVSPEEKDEINDAVDRSTLIAAAIIILVVIGCIGYFVLIRNRD